MVNLKTHAGIVGPVFIVLLLCFQPVLGQNTLGKAIDCTDIRIDYADDPALTKEERLRRMDAAFYESLDKFEYCQSVKGKAKAAGDGQPGDGSAGSAGESVASSVMSGTEKPKKINPSEVSGGQEIADSLPRSQDVEVTGSGQKEKGAPSSGKLPEDIPPAANDDILAAQIRYAAENEADPGKRNQLWDEYRKYKGLAPVEN